MNDEITPTPVVAGHEPDVHHLAWYRQKIVLFVAASIVVAGLLVVVSMILYTSSGTAQLDGSRPGFKAIQKELDPGTTFESFPANGPVDNKSLDQFQKLYQKGTAPVSDTNVYNDSVISPQALGIDDPGANE